MQIESLNTNLENRPNNLVDLNLQRQISLAVVDTKPLMLAAFSNFIQKSTDEYLVNPFNSIDELINMEADQYPFQIIVFNIGSERFCEQTTPNPSIARLKQQFPETPLVLLADCEDSDCIICAIKSGAQGYLSTALMPEVVIAALNLVVAGGVYVPVQTLFSDIGQPRQIQATSVSENTHRINLPDPVYFTPRQLEVLEHVKLGEPNKIIAYKLGMQECTVKVHVRDVMKKLNATNRTQLVYKAQQLSEQA